MHYYSKENNEWNVLIFYSTVINKFKDFYTQM